jgi:hypothetical protein
MKTGKTQTIYRQVMLDTYWKILFGDCSCYSGIVAILQWNLNNKLTDLVWIKEYCNIIVVNLHMLS